MASAACDVPTWFACPKTVTHPGTGMTNYRNGPTTDHSGVVFDYNELVLDRVAHSGTSYGISEP